MSAAEGRLAVARDLLQDFARRTGVTSDAPPRRYLWTDAFAVCGFLELARRTGEAEHARTAIALVAQVHAVLGRHRGDDGRSGWISGLDEEAGHAHPTRGGLRIGKALPERGANEPVDEGLEWERDGQYFHYLTRWMHALARCAGAPVADEDGSEAQEFLRWAVELAETAHARFAHDASARGQRALWWKMSIDLSRPLLPSSGQHDPLDGYLTLLELQAACARAGPERVLEHELADLRAMCRGGAWATDDPLGLGGLLCDAYRLAALQLEGAVRERELLLELLRAAALGLRTLAQGGQLHGPPARRLAFRELGLAIGLHALEHLAVLVASEALEDTGGLVLPVEELSGFLPLAEHVEATWLDPDSRATPAWRSHEDIDAVMLATSLVPDGYVEI